MRSFLAQSDPRGVLFAISACALAAIAGCPMDSGSIGVDPAIGNPVVTINNTNNQNGGTSSTSGNPVDDADDPSDASNDDDGDDAESGDRLVAAATFADDDEGWTVEGGDFTGPAQPSWAPGTNRISANAKGLWHFVAPDDFLADGADAIGGTLQFDLHRATARCGNGVSGFDGVIVLQSTDWTIRWGNVTGNDGFSGTIRVKLDSSDEWKVLGGSDESAPAGSRATDEIIAEVLSDSPQLKIFGQRGRCSGLAQLSNVAVFRAE